MSVRRLRRSALPRPSLPIRPLLFVPAFVLAATLPVSAALALAPCDAPGEGWCLERRISGDVPGGELGFRFGSPLDVDGDGRADIAAGSRFKRAGSVFQNGAAAAWSGATGAPIREWDGVYDKGLFGHSVLPIADLDGDGLADMVVAAPSAVIEDRTHGVLSAHSPKSGRILWTKIAEREEGLGWHLAPAGDQNGDGTADLFAGAPCDGIGHVYLVSGRDGSTLRTYEAPTPRASFGWYLADTDDLDQDGLRDVVVGNLQGDSAPADPSSEVYLLSSATGRVLLQWKEPDRLRAFGEVVAGVGDLDGDGHGDVAIASPRTTGARDALAGDVQIFSGITGTELRRWSGRQGGERYGRMVAGAGDVDGDGIDDVAIGAPHFKVGERDFVGRAEIRSGKSGAVIAEFVGEQAGSWMGWQIWPAPDPDGLGRPALLLGSLRQSVNGQDATGVIDLVVLRAGKSVDPLQAESP